MVSIPVVTIQCDWNDVIRLPNGEAWISSKYIHQTSVHDKLTTSVNKTDGKIKINFTDNYQYISHGNLSLVVKHLSSGLKVAFIAATKAHKVHNKAILSVGAAESPLVVSSCEGDRLLVWDSRTSEVTQDLKGHGGSVYRCRFFPSGIVILSTGADGSSRIWSAESGINPVTLVGHKMAVSDVSIIDRGRNVITVSKDGTAKLWDVGQSNCLENIIEGHGQINCCDLGMASEEVTVNNEREVATGNKLLVAGCESGAVICVHVAKRQEVFNKQLQAPCNACFVVENSVIVGCSDGKVIQLSLRDGSVIKEWYESANPVLSLASLSNQLFVVGRQDGTCTVLSLNEAHSGVRVQLTGSDCDGIRDIAFNGKWVLAGSRDAHVRKYDYNQIIVHFK